MVIDIYCPPPLHTKLGIVNGLYDVLDGILVAKGHRYRAKNWSDSLEGIQRSQYHGGEFKGNQCDLLLNNIDKLEIQLKSAGAFSDCLPIIEAFKAFLFIGTP